MAINSGVNISKAVAFAVMDLAPGVNVSKAVAFAVLQPVDPPAWSGSAFPNGILNAPYGASVPLSLGTPVMAFAVQSGSLPTGLSLSSSGTIATLSGTPTVAGTFTFTLRASNSFGPADQAFTITISALGGGGGSYAFAC